MARRIFVADGNWYMHRAYYTLKTSRDIGPALAYRFISMICKDALDARATHIMVAFDGAHVFRHKLVETYKANRDKKEKQQVKLVDQAMDAAAKGLKSKKGKKVQTAVDADNAEGHSIYDHLTAVCSALADLGIPFFQPPKFEGDDVLCSMANLIMTSPEHEDDLFIGGTRDKDGYQWVRNRAWMYDGQNKRWIRPKDVLRLKGVKPTQMVDYQVLVGDGGDNIEGMKNFGPKTAVKILTEFGSIAKWYENGGKEVRAKLKAASDHMRLTRQLVRLVHNALPPFSVDEMRLPRPNGRNTKNLPSSYVQLQEAMWPKQRKLFGK